VSASPPPRPAIHRAATRRAGETAAQLAATGAIRERLEKVDYT